MKLRIEIDEVELKKILFNHLLQSLDQLPIEAKDLVIQVKSKQNYKSEWETASFRAVLEVDR